MGYGASLFSVTGQPPIKNVSKHNKFLNSRKSYAIPHSPNGSAGGCIPAYAVSGGISPLTCTIFDPSYLGGIILKYRWMQPNPFGSHNLQFARSIFESLHAKPVSQVLYEAVPGFYLHSQ